MTAQETTANQISAIAHNKFNFILSTTMIDIDSLRGDENEFEMIEIAKTTIEQLTKYWPVIEESTTIEASKQMNLIVKQVEGTTKRKGAKQNKTYTNLVLAYPENPDLHKHYRAECGTIISNFLGDWSEIGIRRKGIMRTTYTKNFEIIFE